MQAVLCDMFSVDLFRAVELVVRVWVGGGGGGLHTHQWPAQELHTANTHSTPHSTSKALCLQAPPCGVVNVGSTEPARPPPPHVE